MKKISIDIQIELNGSGIVRLARNKKLYKFAPLELMVYTDKDVRIRRVNLIKRSFLTLMAAVDEI